MIMPQNLPQAIKSIHSDYTKLFEGLDKWREEISTEALTEPLALSAELGNLLKAYGPEVQAEQVQALWQKYIAAFQKSVSDEFTGMNKKLAALKDRVNALSGDDVEDYKGPLLLQIKTIEASVAVIFLVTQSNLKEKQANILNILVKLSQRTGAPIPNSAFNVYGQIALKEIRYHEAANTVTKLFVASVALALAANSLGYQIPAVQAMTKKAFSLTGRGIGGAIEYGGALSVSAVAGSARLIEKYPMLREGAAYLTALGLAVYATEKAQAKAADLIKKNVWTIPVGLGAVAFVATHENLRKAILSVFSERAQEHAMQAVYYGAVVTGAIWAKNRIKTYLPESVLSIPSIMKDAYNIVSPVCKKGYQRAKQSTEEAGGFIGKKVVDFFLQ